MAEVNPMADARPTFGNAVGPASVPSFNLQRPATLGEIFVPPSPQRAPQADPKADPNIDKMLGELHASMPEEHRAIADTVNAQDTDSLLAQLKESLGSTPPASNEFDDKASIVDPNSGVPEWKQKINFLFAKNREGLGSNEAERKAALESMYGKDGYQIKKGEAYVKRSDGKFVKVDQQVVGPVLDTILKNILPAIPVAANIAAQGATMAGAGVAAPESAGASLGLLAESGAIGGGAETATKKAIQGGLDLVSAQPQLQGSFTDQLAQTSLQGAESVGWNVAGNLAALGLSNAYKSKIGQSAVGKLSEFMKDQSGSGLARATAKAGEKEVTGSAKMLAARLQLENFVNEMQGVLQRVKSPGQGGRDLEAAVGQRTASAIDAVTQDLGTALEMTKSKALELSKQSGQKVDANSLFKQMESTFSDHGIQVVREGSSGGGIVPNSPDYAEMPSSMGRSTLKSVPVRGEVPLESGGIPVGAERAVVGSRPEVAVQPEAMPSSMRFALASPHGNAVLSGVVEDYNALKKIAAANNGQIPPEMFYNVYQKYADMAKYDVETSQFPKVKELYSKLNGAAIADRVGFEGSLFEGKDLTESALLNQAYEKYAAHAGKIGELTGLLKGDASRKMMVNTINTASPSQKLNLLTNIRDIVGKESDVWNQFRGEIWNNTIEKAIDPKTGIVEGDKLIKMIGKEAPEILNTIATKEEIGALRRIAKESTENIMAEGGKVNVKAAFNAFKGLSQLVRQDPHGAAKTFIKLVGNNAATLDYVIDSATMDAARAAANKDTQMEFMRIGRYLEEFRDASRRVVVKRGGINIPIYIPIGGRALSAGAQMAQPQSMPEPPPPDDSMQGPQ